MPDINFNPKLELIGISHINVVVDNVEEATTFYAHTLGFEQAKNTEGLMDYPELSMPEFSHNAGYSGELLVHIRFLKHSQVGVFLELMKYDLPQGVARSAGNPFDRGGVRHIALEARDIVAFYKHLSECEGVIDLPANPPIKLENTELAFFYWTDKYQVRWEIESGRLVDRIITGVTG